jgi:hypothetical protein
LFFAYATQGNVTIIVYTAVTIKTLQQPTAIIPGIFLAQLKEMARNRVIGSDNVKLTASEFENFDSHSSKY